MAVPKGESKIYAGKSSSKQILIYFLVNKTNFQTKDFGLGFVLKQRPKASLKGSTGLIMFQQLEILAFLAFSNSHLRRSASLGKSPHWVHRRRYFLQWDVPRGALAH